jgi:betaine-aldehyde dehydrogenase
VRSLSTGSTANGLSPTKSQNRSNPATGAVLGEWADGGEAEARAAIAAARRAFDTASWSRDRVLRHRALSEMADRFDAHADELGALVTKENGKILAQGRFESTTVGGTLRHNAADALIDTGISAEVAPGQWFSTYAEPVGVVGIIVPWNAPVALLIRSLAPALSAGNTVAVKMPGQTALVANLISQIIAEVTSLPRGVVNIFTESGNTGAPYLVAPRCPGHQLHGQHRLPGSQDRGPQRSAVPGLTRPEHDTALFTDELAVSWLSYSMPSRALAFWSRMARAALVSI